MTLLLLYIYIIIYVNRNTLNPVESDYRLQAINIYGCIHITIIKKTLKKMKEYVGIYIKTEKAQEQDDFGNKMKYHFHITTVRKYHFFVFCLYFSYIYLCRVVMWKLCRVVMWKCRSPIDHFGRIFGPFLQVNVC